MRKYDLYITGHPAWRSRLTVSQLNKLNIRIDGILVGSYVLRRKTKNRPIKNHNGFYEFKFVIAAAYADGLEISLIGEDEQPVDVEPRVKELKLALRREQEAVRDAARRRLYGQRTVSSSAWQILNAARTPERLLSETEIVSRSVPVERPKPGVYFLIKDGVVTYVGQSIAPSSRIFQHGFGFDRVFVLPCEQRRLMEVEKAYIAYLVPPRNGMRSVEDKMKQNFFAR